MRTAVVVDDEPITRLDFTQMLEEMGISVVGDAADGFDAVELCRLHRPDLVLIDLRMPVFDGVSASERLIKDDLAKAVVVITAYSDEPTITRAIEAGVGGYLIKPVDKAALYSAIHLALAHRERCDTLNARIIEADNAIEEIKLIERAKSSLAQNSGISEADAYRKIQKLAMDKRCPMGVIAKHILENNDVSEVAQKAKSLLMRTYSLSEKEAFRRLNSYAKEHNCTIQQAAKRILEMRGKL